MNIIPKEKFIKSTRELIGQATDESVHTVLGLTITTHPEVFNPITFFSSQWFAENIAQLVSTETSFLEVGCGSGIVSLYIKKQNPTINVSCTDINPQAKILTQKNSENNNLEVSVFCGDVFDGIPSGLRFDSIFWAMPFGFLAEDENLSGRDWQVFDPGYRAIKKFFSHAKDFLNSDGRLLIGFSKDIGHLELLQEIAHQNEFDLKLINETEGVEKDSVSMEIWEARAISLA
jgi:release factor glutamine methyltransferase